MKTNLKIDQAMVNRIIARAKASALGLGETERPPNINLYEPKNLENLSLVLVSSYYEKYDIVSVFLAALQEVAETHPST